MVQWCLVVAISVKSKAMYNISKFDSYSDINHLEVNSMHDLFDFFMGECVKFST